MMRKSLIFLCLLSQVACINSFGFTKKPKAGVCSFDFCCDSVATPTVTKSCCDLVFTAPDMNKDGQNPDTSFSGVYDDVNFNLQAWRMKPSNEGQQEISLMFGMPAGYQFAIPVEITFYLLVEQNSGSVGNTANIRIRLDHKGTLQEVGPNFAAVYSTGNFMIVEPSTNKTLETVIVTTTLNGTGIMPKDWVLFVFDRIAPTGEAQEYSKNIYLAGVDVRFCTQS